jgi:hypothetical protein
MALGIRFVALHSTISANGRSYPATVGSMIEIAFPDAAAVQSDQATTLMIVGATADRPGNSGALGIWPPAVMYDTTLSKVIFLVPGSNPARWIDIAGASV